MDLFDLSSDHDKSSITETVPKVSHGSDHESVKEKGLLFKRRPLFKALLNNSEQENMHRSKNKVSEKSSLNTRTVKSSVDTVIFLERMDKQIIEDMQERLKKHPSARKNENRDTSQNSLQNIDKLDKSQMNIVEHKRTPLLVQHTVSNLQVTPQKKIPIYEEKEKEKHKAANAIEKKHHHVKLRREDRESLKQKAIKDFKKSVHYQQYNRKMKERGEKKAPSNPVNETSPLPVRNRKRMVKQLIFIVFFVMFTFVALVAMVLLLHTTKYAEKERNLDDIYNETEEYDVFICEDEKRLCDFEVEDLCENCRCLHSFVFLEETLFGMNILENVYVLDIKIGSVLAFNTTQIRSGFLSETLCNLCEDIENPECEVDGEVQCCTNLEYSP
eukprot:snap_masked-scaffold_8-processed-gene-11.29-mRNA-1 protein AED:1.00 eAED:1.00 QI:0/0/0/0/1/1/3/0/385